MNFPPWAKPQILFSGIALLTWCHPISVQHCPGCCQLLVWTRTCSETRFIRWNLQEYNIKNLLAYFKRNLPDKMFYCIMWVNWKLCCLTLLILCSSCGSGRPAAQEGGRIAPTPAFYEDYTPPAHRRKNTCHTSWFQNLSTMTTRTQYTVNSELWPHMHQSLRRSAGWTWPPQVGLPVAQQPKWP